MSAMATTLSSMGIGSDLLLSHWFLLNSHGRNHNATAEAEIRFPPARWQQRWCSWDPCSWHKKGEMFLCKHDPTIGKLLPTKKPVVSWKWLCLRPCNTTPYSMHNCPAECLEVGRTDHCLPVEIHQECVLQSFAQVLLFKERIEGLRPVNISENFLHQTWSFSTGNRGAITCWHSLLYNHWFHISRLSSSLQ